MQQLVRPIKAVALLLLSLAIASCTNSANIRMEDAENNRADSTFDNRIPILGVIGAENRHAPAKAELLTLGLRIQPGSGQVYVSLGAIQKIDTQVGLLLAHETTCDYLALPCAEYDFYYAFYLGDRTVVGGQSASAAAGYLLAKTLNFEKVDPTVVVTGGLAPGAILARTDGVEAKIELAQSLGFSKIYIPANTVCTNSAYCTGFRLNHQECSIGSGSVSCPRRRTNEQSPIELTGCTTSVAEADRLFAMSCNQMIGGRDVRLEYSQCKQSCKSSGPCTLKCDAPLIHGFIDVVPVIGLEAMLGQDSAITGIESTSLLSGHESERIAEHYTALQGETENLESWDQFYLGEAPVEGKTKVSLQLSVNEACERTNQHLQLNFQTLRRFHASGFKSRIAHLQSLAQSGDNPALCLYRGIELEAELSITKNFLDMGTNAKRHYLKKLLRYTKSKLPDANSQYLLPYYFYNFSCQALAKGDIDAAYLMANKAIGFSSRHLPTQ